VIGTPPALFQIPLIAQANSGYWEQQLRACHLVQFLIKKTLNDLATKIIDVSFLIFGLFLNAKLRINAESVYLLSFVRG
jgi:hypothetical protein